jgi:hypothetical protein
MDGDDGFDGPAAAQADQLAGGVTHALFLEESREHLYGHVVGALIHVDKLGNGARLRDGLKVLGTVITTSPASTPQAMMAKRKASVPLLTAMAWRVFEKLAKSSSNFSTTGPPTKAAVRSPWRKALTNSLSSSMWGVTKSRKGIGPAT